jgi:stage II sporulation protein AA (anti-sigma F factor antagonist)
MRLADLQFSIREDALVARILGEIDMSNSEELRDAIFRSTPNEIRGVVLDVSDVDYLDSAGIHLIYRLREALRARGQRLILAITARSTPADALRLAGVMDHIDLAETVDDALRTLRAPDSTDPELD